MALVASLLMVSGCLLMAATRKVYPLTPEQLVQGAREVAEHIQLANRDMPGPWSPALSRHDLAMPHGRLLMAPAVGPTQRKRETPVILTVRDLQTHFIRRAVRLGEPAQSGAPTVSRRIGGLRAVLVTGLVPFEDQFEEFANRLPVYAGVSVERNILRYTAVRIERAEVDSDGKQTAWSPLDGDPIRNQLRRWDGLGRDPVPPAARLHGTTQPLPPVVGGWELSEVSHARLDCRPRGPLETSRPPAFRMGRDGAIRFDRPRKPRHMVSHVSQYRLFRFLDTSVQPRKTYRYRVQLVMANPNFGLDPKYLQSDVDAESSTLVSGYAQPSPPQHVNSDTLVLAGPMIIPQNSRHPVRIRLLVRYWDQSAGLHAVREFEVAPGERIEAFAVETAVLNPATGRAELRKVDFDTGESLLAADGALRPDGRWIRHPIPSRLTLASDDHWITWCNAATDQARYERLLAEQQALESQIHRPGPPNVLFERYEERE